MEKIDLKKCKKGDHIDWYGTDVIITKISKDNLTVINEDGIQFEPNIEVFKLINNK